MAATRIMLFIPLLLWGIWTGLAATAIPISILGAASGGAEGRKVLRLLNEGRIRDLVPMEVEILRAAHKEGKVKVSEDKPFKGVYLPEDVWFQHYGKLPGDDTEFEEVVVGAYSRYCRYGAILEAANK